MLTGTRWACGEFMQPPLSLQAGDVAEIEIERIGTVRDEVAVSGKR